jgi:hypothetical protein
LLRCRTIGGFRCALRDARRLDRLTSPPLPRRRYGRYLPQILFWFLHATQRTEMQSSVDPPHHDEGY